jgi:hypothetical protein
MTTTVIGTPVSLFAQQQPQQTQPMPKITPIVKKSRRGIVGSPDVYDLEFTRTVQEVCAHGWVARMGYSCRATDRAEAIRNAIVATIHALLAHPVALWDDEKHVSSRDSYIELNRAVPAFSYDEKMGICYYIYTKLSDYLRIKHAFDCVEKGSAFAIALEVSRNNRKWDTETCAACGQARDVARYPIVIFIPCEHVACMRAGCATFADKDVIICPYCNPRPRDDAPMSLHICARMHIIVNYDLEIPTTLIDDFAKKIAYANII